MGVVLSVQHGSPYWWESPAIWAVPGTNPDGVPGSPIAGSPAYLWAEVANTGDEDAANVQLDFWVATPSPQILKSAATHIGTAFADIAAGSLQDVLCLVPWNVSIFNSGHECVVVEASSPLDPLNPTPTDPDVLDGELYPQIAQHNYFIQTVASHQRHEMIITVSAGLRREKVVEVRLEPGRPLSRALLKELKLDEGARRIGEEKLLTGLSHRSTCDVEIREDHKALDLSVPKGTSAPVYLNVHVSEPLASDEYGLVRVVEVDQGRITGGISMVVVRPPDDEKGES